MLRVGGSHYVGRVAGGGWSLPFWNLVDPVVAADPGLAALAQKGHASFEPVAPLARLAVGPEDFPLLESIQGHDPDVMQQRAQRDPDAFPWVDV